jgi:hypothetical protein
MQNSEKLANILRKLARLILLIIALFWFSFALLSGAEEYGGGLTGIIKNSPNALPWLLLLVVVFIAWKWELLGGILIAGLGIFTIFAFNVFNESLYVFFLITLPLILLGGFFIASWYLRRKQDNTTHNT